MGKVQSKLDESGNGEEKEVCEAQDMMRQRLESWKDVNVKIGVTGGGGVGKSCFINAIRGYGSFILSNLC